MIRLCLTIDIDWAPDFVVEWMAKRVKDAGVSATWFATHDSPVLRQIAADPSQEVGIHPNFFQGSTQGKTMEEIVDGLIDMYPGARGARAHALLDSTRHQQYYAKCGIKYISNSLVWNIPSNPFFQPWTGLWQIPISWEDDVACGYVKDISLALPKSRRGCLWVVVFHPLYCYLNEKEKMLSYAAVKARYPDIRKASLAFLNSVRRKGKGLSNTLDSVLGEPKPFSFLTLGGVYDELVNAKGLRLREDRSVSLSRTR